MIKSLINNKKNKKRKAFTLIELIIVICIIAILAAIAVPKFLEINENAKVKTDISNAQNIANATSTLIAEEEITLSSTGLNFEVKSGDATGKKVIDYMDNTPKVRSNKDSNKGKDYYVEVSAKGNVTVFAGKDGKQAYPTPSDTSETYYVK